MSSKLRLLCLPGYTSNAYSMRAKTGAVRNACKEVEFVYLDPPHICAKADLPPGFLDSVAPGTETDDPSDEFAPRAWFFAKDVEGAAEGVKRYTMMDETFGYLHDYLIKEPPFDGVLGFSQGSCMAALLSALMEKPNLHPRFQPHENLKPFKFAILVGGFATADPTFHNFYPLALPTLHVLGRNDTIVTPERGMTLVDRCTDARLEMHDGGHFVPSKATWRHFFNAYLNSFRLGGSQGDVPSPAASASAQAFGATTPASGAATPVSHAAKNKDKTRSPSLDEWQKLVGADPVAKSTLADIRSLTGKGELPAPQIQAYPDVAYYNYHPIGVSLCCKSAKGERIPDDVSGYPLVVESIDLFNTAPPRPNRSNKPVFAQIPGLPLPLSESFDIKPQTTGRDLVMALGEPSKKGGGTGWLDVWLEWSALGIQVDLRDPKGAENTEELKKKGLGGVWDQAASWVWVDLKIFRPEEAAASEAKKEKL